jgi:hypothetical protein
VNFGAPWANVQYARDDRTGLVYIRGLMKSGSISTTLPAFILPLGYRPANDVLFAVISNGAIGRLSIQGSDGYVIPYAGNNAYYNFSGVLFSVFQ